MDSTDDNSLPILPSRSSEKENVVKNDLKSRRRHSSTIEITAKTNVQTGQDGMPIISFSFLHDDEKNELWNGKNHQIENNENNTQDKNITELYDFPKHSHPSSNRLSELEGCEQQTETFNSIVYQASTDYDQPNYDLPKQCQVSLNCDDNKTPKEPIITNEQISMNHDEHLNDEVASEDGLYETLRSKEDTDVISDIKNTNNKIPEHLIFELNPRKSSVNIPVSVSEAERRKKYHIAKAWHKMQRWLREEKIKLGEVVQRHAKMQAVGAVQANCDQDSSSVGRCGFYDLVAARAREFGSVVQEVEEPGIVSKSDETAKLKLEEDFQVISHDSEIRKTVECLQDDVEKVQVEKKSPEIVCVKQRKRIASSENIVSERRLKLAPVSFSLDKLSDIDGNNQKDEKEKNNSRTAMAATKDVKLYVGKGEGLIKRRMLGSIRGLMASTHLLHQHHDIEETGPGGFEDIRRYVKQGGDFCKELASILHERAELEASYAKGLSKLSSKLTKACSKDQGGNSTGGVNEAWRNVGEEMEAAAEAHRVWGIALSEQLAKPLRVGVAEAQGRSRKSIESSVDKASKSLQEWRSIAAKSKKQSFTCARENERLQDLARIQSISQSQQNNNKTSSHHMTEKEVNKLENRRRKAEDASRRADTEFYTVSVRAERARLEYESTVRKGAKQMELLEEERLSALKDLANVYLAHLQALAPRLQQSADRLATPVRNCSVSQDVDILKNLIRRMDSNDAASVDQLLPDFYAEHVTLAMNRERRKQALVRVLHLIRQDLERERRGRDGLETLHRAFIQTPAFAADESTQNVMDKLHHMRSMLTYLEAARYKVGGALAEVEGGKKGKHPLAEHILVSRDKQGLQQSVLKMPPWAKNESFELPDVDEDIEDIHLSKDHEVDHHEWIDRTAGDGNSENPPDEEDFSDFDEFSSQSEDNNNNQEVDVVDITSEKCEKIEQCRAIYQYSANLNDELSLTPGDLITIHQKQADGWWIGECGGKTGIFPATYVQVIH
ncbi:uncharacterized protein Nost isoform X2 [Chelonus insularis]|uniref:uncharacterized protein Nost isoform X2 n=1 Tax=Chelonus insularis TaxID=460826 RepID=UPI0015894211|nr:uncharacterized protein LOC118069819 isoform X2 [Chelonus insularis]